MMCGLTGSGKTTWAKRLEREHNAVRFSVDEWMIDLYGHHMPREVFDERLAAIKDLLWSVAQRLLALEVNVVLDFGFWKRAERLEFQSRVRTVNAVPILYFFDLPLAELRRRLAARNEALDEGTFEVTPEMLEMFASWFEPPTEAEGFDLVRVGFERDVDEGKMSRR